MDAILHKSLLFTKQCAREFYFSFWATEPPQCPAFAGEVIHVSHEGWNHLVHDRKRKNKLELIGRLTVLERAKHLLETATHFQQHVERGGVMYWSFEADIHGVRVKAIVRSIHGGEKHFYSVMRKGSVVHEIK